MANSPFLKLPFSIGGAGLGIIASTDQKTMFPPSPETDAVGHWDLGTNALSLTDQISGRVLVPNAAAPTFDALGMKIPDGGPNGLISDIADRASGYTYAIVFQPQASLDVSGQSTFLLGSTQSAGGDAKGGGLYTNGSGATPPVPTIIDLARPASGGTSSNTSRTLLSTVRATNAWVFVLASFDAAGNRFLYIPGHVTATSTGNTKAASDTRKLALGNVYYLDPAYYYGQKYSEFIVWDRGLTQAEAAAVFQRTIQRMKYRKGITLFGAS